MRVEGWVEMCVWKRWMWGEFAKLNVCSDLKQPHGSTSLTRCPIAGPDAHCHPPHSPSSPHNGEGFGGAFQSSGGGGAELEASSTSLVINDCHQGGEIGGGETGGGGCGWEIE